MTTRRWIGLVMFGVWCVSGGTAAASEDKPPRAETKAHAKSDAKVNINEASKAELMKLNGVSSGVAQKIIAYREAHGPFKRLHDLEKVEGLDKAVLEKNAGRITVK